METREAARHVMVGGVITCNGRRYANERLVKYTGELVRVVYDPEAMESVTVEDYQSKEIICEALEA